VKEKKPSFKYITDCCGALGTKEPCERDESTRKEKKFGEASLGKWRCTNCHKHAKVTRRKVE